MFSRLALQILFGITLFLSPYAHAIEGVYSGKITLNNEAKTEVPLKFSLAVTGERIFTPRGDERPVIDASVLVGEEGGPYACSKVTLDIDDSEIDIRYLRPKSNLTETSPSNFRLIGVFKTPQIIEGRVLSGTKGPVGKFYAHLSRTERLEKQLIYQGHWKGKAKSPEGFEIPMEIVLRPTEESIVNPEEYEFEYSMGKVASVKWNNTRLAFDRVYVDYIRRKVTMVKSNARGQSGIALEFTLKPDGSIQGAINSSLRGVMANFDLEELAKSVDAL